MAYLLTLNLLMVVDIRRGLYSSFCASAFYCMCLTMERVPFDKLLFDNSIVAVVVVADVNLY